MSEYNIEQLLKKINELETELKTSKKYGLVWDKENTKEDVVIKCEKNIPILEQDKSKKIIFGDDNNIIIEGDNYHALTSLNFIAKESVDIVYIDPPYNTGHEDFIYNDNYVDSEDGYRHSKWLSFMQKRLALSKELLKEKSLLFIRIDDREYAQLKLLCDSIFGERNFVANLKWKKKKQPSFLSNVAGILEYVLVYSKNAGLIKKLSIEQLQDSDKPVINAGNPESERIIRKGCRAKCTQTFIKAGLYQNKSMTIEYVDDVYIENGITKNDFRCISRFRTTQEYIDQYCEENLIFITANLGLRRDLSSNEKGGAKSITDLLLDWDQNQDGTTTLKEIFNLTTNCPFSNPKPVKLIYNCIKSSMFNNPVVLDFFAGSGTTGQAVLELNKEDGGHRRFILCTNNENNICTEVTYPRLKTVITGIRPDGTKYSDGLPANLYYFKTDFIEDQANTEQARYNLVEKVDSLLCIAEDVMEEVERNDYSSHFINGDKHLFIYNDYYNKTKFDEFKQRVLSATGQKIVYVYASDNNIDETLMEGNDIELKPIPSKIYEIYKEIVEDIKRGE